MTGIRKKYLSLLLVLAFIIQMPLSALGDQNYPTTQASQAINRAMNYLHQVQNTDGGFPSKAGDSSSPAVTCWVLMALRAAGQDAAGTEWASAGKTPVDYFAASTGSLEATSDYARTLLALSAANRGTNFKGTDIVKSLVSFQQGNGQFAQLSQNEDGFINSHIWSIIALAAAGEKIPNQEQARQWLIAGQNQDGSFGWVRGIAGDADDTAAAVQAMLLLGEKTATSKPLQKAFTYLKTCQQADGGFSSGWTGNQSNAVTDAWMICALSAAGENPVGDKWAVAGKNAVSHLLSLQNSSGAFDWMTGTSSQPVTTTAYAIIALERKSFPVNLNYSANQMESEKPGQFSDVATTYWAYQPIMQLAATKIITGYPDGTFKPENQVTRAEFTCMLAKALNLGEQRLSGTEFKDVGIDFWAGSYIAAAAEKGYIKGRPGGIFNPDGRITGAELATILVQVLNKGTMVKNPGPAWYSGFVQTAKADNLLYPDFQPLLNCTRAQCAFCLEQLKNSMDKR